MHPSGDSGVPGYWTGVGEAGAPDGVGDPGASDGVGGGGGTGVLTG